MIKILRIAIFCFITFCLLNSCSKEELTKEIIANPNEVEAVVDAKTIEVNAIDIPEILEQIDPSFKATEFDFNLTTSMGAVGLKNILKRSATGGGVSYSFPLFPNKVKQNSVFNLVVVKVADQEDYMTTVVEYRMTDEFGERYAKGELSFDDFEGNINLFPFQNTLNSSKSAKSLVSGNTCVQNIDEVVNCTNFQTSKGGSVTYSSTGAGGSGETTFFNTEVYIEQSGLSATTGTSSGGIVFDVSITCNASKKHSSAAFCSAPEDGFTITITWTNSSGGGSSGSSGSVGSGGGFPPTQPGRGGSPCTRCWLDEIHDAQHKTLNTSSCCDATAVNQDTAVSLLEASVISIKNKLDIPGLGATLFLRSTPITFGIESLINTKPAGNNSSVIAAKIIEYGVKKIGVAISDEERQKSNAVILSILNSVNKKEITGDLAIDALDKLLVDANNDLLENLASIIETKPNFASVNESLAKLLINDLYSENGDVEFRDEMLVLIEKDSCCLNTMMDPLLLIKVYGFYKQQKELVKQLHPEWSEGQVLAEVWLNIAQLGLDAIGLIPGVGEVADLANGVIYLVRGDKLNAGLSFAAMIPFAGWGATAGKLAIKIVPNVITGTKKVLYITFKDGKYFFGARTDLAKVIVKNGSQEAHHIIPWAKSSDSVVQKAADAGFHMNDPTNGVALEKFSKITGDGLHGNHPAYDTFVEKQLLDFRDEFPNATGMQAKSFLENELIPDLLGYIETAKNYTGGNLNDYFKNVVNNPKILK